MKRDEAIKKWCPFMGGSHPNSSNGANDNCIGSDCAAWRKKIDEVSEMDEDGSVHVTFINKGEGYCGLAGK